MGIRGNMNSKRSNSKLKNNMISSSVYQVLVMIVPIVTTPYVTRIFDVKQMGLYSLSLTLASLFVVIAQFGLPTYGSREIATSNTTNESSLIFFHLESIQIMMSILAFITYNILFLVIFDYGNKALFFTQSLLIIANIFDISWFFIGIEEIKNVIIRNALSKLLTTLLIFIMVKNENQLVLYALINVIGVLVGNLSMMIQCRKYIDFSLQKFRLKKRHMKNSFRLLIPVFVNTSYDSAEKSILTIITTTSQVGIYSEAKKIINLAASVLNSAFNALSPRMSHYVSIGKLDTLNKYFMRGLVSSNIFSIFAVSGFFAVADSFVSFFYGPGYDMVAIVIKISSISLLTIPITALINRGILIPHGKDIEYTNSILIVLISGVIMNLILDRRYGAIGAAISFSVTQLLSFIYVVFKVRHLIIIKKLVCNLVITSIFILINILLMLNLPDFINDNNAFLSFITNGLISAILSFILIMIGIRLSKRIHNDI